VTNVRALAESDLSHTVEGELAVPVTLISPDGERIDKTARGGQLAGRVLWSHKEVAPETGEEYIVHSPVVKLRESSLLRVPKSGEVWGVIIPERPIIGAPLKHYVTDEGGIARPNRNFGTVALFLVEVGDKEGEAGDGGV